MDYCVHTPDNLANVSEDLKELHAQINAMSDSKMSPKAHSPPKFLEFTPWKKELVFLIIIIMIIKIISILPIALCESNPCLWNSVSSVSDKS
jgi:hypothetical protein